jgi:pilus assembly protein CpaB
VAKRIIAIVAAVTLAAFGTVVLVLYVQSAEDRALAGEETVEVLVVAEDVPRGTPAEGLAGRTRLERIPVKVQATGSVDSLDALGGRVTSAPLVAGEQVISGRFVDPSALSAVDVPEGLLQVTVSLPADRVVGGMLNPGDTVAVFSSFTGVESEVSGTDDEDDDTRTRKDETTHLTLHKVLVTNVQGNRGSQSGPGSPGASDDEAEEDQHPVPSGNLLVTLAIDAPSAERVVFTAEHGSVWLALEPDDAPEDGTRIQTKETIYQ